MSTQKQTASLAEPAPALDPGLVSALLKTGILTEDLFRALEKKSSANQSIFETLLLNEGYLIDEQLGQLKAQVHGWKYVNLRNEEVDASSLALLPRPFAVARNIVPFRSNGNILFASAHPDHERINRLLKKKFGPAVQVHYALPGAIREAIESVDVNFERQAKIHLQQHQEARQHLGRDDRSIIELVDSLFMHGVRRRASDIHIEPRKHDSIVRERIDGILHTTLHLDASVHHLISTRIKVLANLATDEHARPQDGKLQYEGPDGNRVDVRVSFSPTTNGEKIVLRLLAPQDQALPLEALGLIGDDLRQIETEMQRSWGKILVTGPTGSGKTTTLYAIVRKLNRDDVNITTIEDPVEYDMPGINQIQVNEKVDVTFANGLRSIVRQDPDIILVGEIRDTETADIAVNAAMTGHLVLSTLHTNDAATALPRLIDMHVEPFLIASTINVIIAQRLVRKVCTKCRQGEEVPVVKLQGLIPDELLKKLARGKPYVRMYAGQKGCPVCEGTGYHGRTGIFEILKIDDGIRKLIVGRSDAETIRNAAIAAGMTTMLDDGIEKILQGVTTIEEVLRVVQS